MLYPEQDGDAAAAALKTALARLRKLVGHDSIQMARGVLSLARERVWVDALALTRALDRGDVEVTETLDRWYRGPFLPHDDAPWARSARQRWQRRVTRALMSAARERASADRIDDAISLAERCLEIDPDDEQASRLLAQCQAAGDSAEGHR